MRELLSQVVRDEGEGEAIDYVLVLGLIVVAALLLIGSLGTKIAERWRAIMDLV